MSFTVYNRIADFFTGLPNIEEQNARRALLNRAGLDPQLYAQINFDDPPAQFFQILVRTLSQYGTLSDSRNALQAVLRAAKNSVGLEKQTECDRLIEAVQRSHRVEQGNQQSDVPQPPKPQHSPVAAMKRRMLEQRQTDLMAKYTAINQQLLGTLNAADKVTLQNHMQQIEQEMQQTETELASL